MNMKRKAHVWVYSVAVRNTLSSVLLCCSFSSNPGGSLESWFFMDTNRELAGRKRWSCPGPESRLWLHLAPNLPHVLCWHPWKDLTADSELQDIHNTGQQDFQEESQWGSSIDSVIVTRGFKPDQWLSAMNNWK